MFVPAFNVGASYTQGDDGGQLDWQRGRFAIGAERSVLKVATDPTPEGAKSRGLAHGGLHRGTGWGYQVVLACPPLGTLEYWQSRATIARTACQHGPSAATKFRVHGPPR